MFNKFVKNRRSPKLGNNNSQRTTPKEIKLDHEGNTPLHLAILNCSNLKEFKSFLSQIEEELAVRMVRTLNNNGVSVYSLVSSSKLNAKESSQMITLLLSLTDKIQFKKASEPVNFNEIKDKYSAVFGTKLYNNLHVACEIANKIRKKNIFATTHPDLNGCEYDKYLMLREPTIRLRGQTNRVDYWCEILREGEGDDQYQVKDNGTSYEFKTRLSDTTWRKYLKQSITPFKEKKIGNCQEVCCMGLYKLLKISIPGSIHEIGPNGDHVFVVLGRDPSTDIHNYTTWNQDTVICDILLGQIFPITDIENSLLAYIPISITQNKKSVIYNMTYYFNPLYHDLNLNWKNSSFNFTIPYDTSNEFYKRTIQTCMGNSTNPYHFLNEISRTNKKELTEVSSKFSEDSQTSLLGTCTK